MVWRDARIQGWSGHPNRGCRDDDQYNDNWHLTAKNILIAHLDAYGDLHTVIHIHTLAELHS